MTALDDALAKARAKKGLTPSPSQKSAPPPTPMSDEERAAAQEKLKADRAAREEEKKRQDAALQAAADEKRQAAKAAKEAKKAQREEMSAEDNKKIALARDKAGPIDELTESLRQNVLAQLSTEQILTLVEHLVVDTRIQRTNRAHASPRVPEGTRVEIFLGDPHLIGKVGMQTSSNASRCHVVVDGKEHFIYRGETRPYVEPVEEDEVEETVSPESPEEGPVVEATPEDPTDPVASDT